MNEDSPFTIHGDEPVEARIVSWVLGEASAFEAAELERLCDERPELLVFRRRMRALHGLLTEAEAAEADESWKLPPEKRRILDEIFGAEKSGRPEAEKEKHIRHSGRRAFFAIAACVVLTLVVLRMTPWKHTSEAIIEVRPQSAGMPSPGTDSNESSMTPQFFGSEFEKIKSRRSLEKVVDNLDLTARWGVDKEQALKIVKDSVKTKNVRGTDLIEIDVRHNNKQDADDIAREVANSYQAYRAEIDSRESERQLHAFNEAVRDQEDKVEERRKVLSTIARTKGIIYRDDESFFNNSNVDELREEAVKRGLDAQDYADAKREFEADQELLQKMKLKRMGATIASKMPSESVVIHEVPSATPSSPARRSEPTSARTPAAPASREPQSAPQAEEIDRVATLADKNSESTDEPQIIVGGHVRSPGGVRYKEGLTLGEAIGAAGGATEFGANKRVKITRDGKLRSYDASKDEFRQMKLEPGDVVEMPQKNFFGDGGDAAPASPAATAMTNTASPAETPTPELDVPTPSTNFGNDDDFGSGWGGGTGRVSGLGERSEIAAKESAGKPATRDMRWQGRLSQSESESGTGDRDLAQREVLRRNAAPTDKQTGKAEVIRESQYPTEYEPPALPNTAAQAAEFPQTPAEPFSLKPEATDSLRKAIREQEDKVEERRKVLSTIVRTKGIIYRGDDSLFNQSGVDEDQGAKNALRTFHQLEQEKMQLESQISSLLKYDNEQLMVYASGLDLPGNAVRELYPKYLETKRQLEADKVKGLGNEHSSVKAKVEQTEVMKRQLDESVINMRSTLAAQLDLASKRLKSIEAMKDETRETAIKRGLDAYDYVDAKREFEMEQERLQQMRLKLNRAMPETPTPDLTKLMEEIAASEDPYSTFSLNISDASFQIAQAALAKGEQPDPAGIKVEQFYNAVDYGDPAPSAGEPVAVSIGQSANPVIPGRNLVRVALKTAASGRSAAQALRLTLLVDQSGSMVREDRRAAMDKALAGLGGLLTENDLVTVIGFSRTPRLLADGVTGDKAGKLADLVNQAASEGGTNLEEAIKLAGQKAMGRKLAGAQNRIVLFTDGAANLGDADPGRLAEKVKVLRQQGISFDIAGIAADGLNDELLGGLARHGNGRYYVVGKGGDDDFGRQLAGAFRPAAENVKVQVRFNPERVGRYKLIGFEKDRLKTEDFRNDAVDAAELAAEEAGVAIYQVEPLPGGSGELGEVSVRFRDSGREVMVERAWTIPYDSKAPALDRAAPSMQLAVLSMLAGEKLKGGPLADAIDFKQFTEAMADVKSHYGNTGRAAEMLRMVDALK